MTTDRPAQIREEAPKDPAMTLLSGYIEKGWPKYERSVPQSARTYYNNRTSLSITDGLIVYENRIVIPPRMRDVMLRRLHESRGQTAPSGGLVSVATFLHLLIAARHVARIDQRKGSNHSALWSCHDGRGRKSPWTSSN